MHVITSVVDPSYSGNHSFKGRIPDFIFFEKLSIFVKHKNISLSFHQFSELTRDSKSVRASCIRLWTTVKTKTGVYELMTYHILVFIQNLVIAVHRYKYHYCRGLIENVYPLFPLRPLATDIINIAWTMFRYIENISMYPCCSCSSVENIVTVGTVRRSAYSIKMVGKTSGDQ